MDIISQLGNILSLVSDIIVISEEDNIIFSNSNIIDSHKLRELLIELESNKDKVTLITYNNKIIKINWNSILFYNYKIFIGKKEEISFTNKIKNFFNKYFNIENTAKPFTQILLNIIKDFIKEFGFSCAQVIIEKNDKIIDNQLIDISSFQSLSLIEVEALKILKKNITQNSFLDIKDFDFLAPNINPNFFKEKNINIDGFFYILLPVNKSFDIHLFIFSTKERDSIIESQQKIADFYKIYEIYIIYFRNIYAVYKAENLKTNFIILLNHELRTPLNSVLGYAQLLSSFTDNPEIIDGLNEIHNAGKDILVKIERMILLQELKFSSYSVKRQIFNLKDVLDKVLRDLKYLIDKKKNIEFNMKINNFELNTDQNLFYHVLFIFIENAIKFTLIGGVLIESLRDNNRVLIKIKDSGPGFDASKIENYFKEFYHVNTNIMTRKVGGLGIGFSLAYEVSKISNINFVIESKINVGTEVTIFIDN
ncbi:MAG TPA: HAMP domain-containing sensor histidine kinase [Spirochaetota bacterium]|nr:HAMP domain-containing sensor histidine kinase [Spirochaetota bacterium]HOM38041.1 HAMP domain-containing sensor histidine kinase [Spirochaetota bacterium]HPQ48845.1 HAMP domain-containing sensor histidine kinase [Spirochaetota bacterium]